MGDLRGKVFPVCFQLTAACTGVSAAAFAWLHHPLQAAPAVDSPGTWRHPRLNEITRRRNATTFTEKNVRQIAYNIAALLALWSLRVVAKLQFSPHS